MKQYGHFDDASREYVVTDPPPPLPWINCLGRQDCFGIIDNRASPRALNKSTGIVSVKWTKGFWKRQFDVCRNKTIPHLKKLIDDPAGIGSMHNFEVKAGIKQGEFRGTDWQDEMLYKWMEAVSYVYAQTKAASFPAMLEPIITVIGKAQDADGYLATQILRHKKRYESPSNHELYVMGHCITAACAHKRFVDTDGFLSIAMKIAAHLYDTFMPRLPRHAHFCINPSIIMSLVELYRVTGDKRHLDLANCFIDMRGSAPRSKYHQAFDLNDAGGERAGESRWLEDIDPDDRPLAPTSRSSREGSDLNQSRVPLRQETEVAGHSVFWSYLYAGAADAYMETGDDTLMEALTRLWDDVSLKKLYVTGGAAAVHKGFHVRDGANPWSADEVHEAVGHRYDLPSFNAYNETCAQIGNFMWNYRMFLANGDAKHLELMETTIYNSILSGIGRDGASWFYTNPLRWHGKEQHLLSQDAHERFQPGKNNICCPSNLVRTIAGYHGYLYTLTKDGISANLYGASVFSGALADGSSVKIIQATEYPWEGAIRFTFEKTPGKQFSFLLRIPAWAERANIKVNGVPQEKTVKAGTLFAIKRNWKNGDVVDLLLPMDVRLLVAHPQVESAVNQITVARGPIIYCLESPDLPEAVDIAQVRIPRTARFTAKYESRLLDGVTTLSTLAAVVPKQDWDGKLYQEMPAGPSKKMRIRLVPYFAWANRGVSKMSVWLPIAFGN
jgi:hypothetical protein